jgi:hypothetical protein
VCTEYATSHTSIATRHPENWYRPHLDYCYTKQTIYLEDSSDSDGSVQFIMETSHNSAAVKEEEVPVEIIFECVKDEPVEEAASGEENVTFQCSVCGEQFTNDQLFKAHRR